MTPLDATLSAYKELEKSRRRARWNKPKSQAQKNQEALNKRFAYNRSKKRQSRTK